MGKRSKKREVSMSSSQLLAPALQTQATSLSTELELRGDSASQSNQSILCRKTRRSSTLTRPLSQLPLATRPAIPVYLWQNLFEVLSKLQTGETGIRRRLRLSERKITVLERSLQQANIELKNLAVANEREAIVNAEPVDGKGDSPAQPLIQFDEEAVVQCPNSPPRAWQYVSTDVSIPTPLKGLVTGDSASPGPLHQEFLQDAVGNTSIFGDDRLNHALSENIRLRQAVESLQQQQQHINIAHIEERQAWQAEICRLQHALWTTQGRTILTAMTSEEGLLEAAYLNEVRRSHLEASVDSRSIGNERGVDVKIERG